MPSPALPSLLRRLSFGVLAIIGLAIVPTAFGQTADVESADEAEQNRGRETVDVEPYTGPPIFLPEGETPPPAIETDSRVIKENYEGTDARRFERRLVIYSDSSVYSEGEHKEFYKNGQIFVEGEFTKSLATGNWTYYHPDGTVAKKVSFISGYPDGEVRVFGKEGQLLAERAYKEGTREGLWVTYDQEGKQKLREENYRDGKAEGEWRIWYKNGQLRQLATFISGKREGLATEWTQVGKKRGESMYVADKRDGKTTLWQRDGTIIEHVYKEGQLVE